MPALCVFVAGSRPLSVAMKKSEISGVFLGNFFYLISSKVLLLIDLLSATAGSRIEFYRKEPEEE
jgi:uncharacterized RDD family membrane protein YckC